MDTVRTLDEILVELVGKLENPQESTIDKKFETEVFGSLKGNEHITQYLRETLSCDVKRYFSASTDDERSQIRGAFSRTAYLLGKITKHNTEDKKKENLRST